MVDELTVHAAPGFWTREKRRDALVITLTLVTGSIDAIGLIRLGGVFTSVMTGNMVFLGIAVSEHSGSIALHTGVAFAAYVLGSFVGARVAGHAPENETHLWPLSVVRALLVEFVIIAVFAAWWEIVRANPSTDVAYALLGLNAVALGIQSSAVLRFGVHGLSTTYLTGTLTQFIAGLTNKGAPKQVRSSLILLAIIAGAALGALCALHAPRIAPLVPLSALGFVVACAWMWYHRRLD